MSEANRAQLLPTQPRVQALVEASMITLWLDGAVQRQCRGPRRTEEAYWGMPEGTRMSVLEAGSSCERFSLQCRTLTQIQKKI